MILRSRISFCLVNIVSLLIRKIEQMCEHICTLAFLFLARLRFLSPKSIPKIIKGRYGESVLKLVCKFERTDLCCRKAELDLSFLKYCFENSLTPKFLRFKVSNVRYAYPKQKFLTRSPLLD